MENLTQYEGKEHFENLVLDIPGKPPCMLDRDLAKIYGVSTKRLNEARERNPRKFTEGVDYFQLTKSEVAICDLKLDTGHLPYAYTKKGSFMFVTILNTDEAISHAVSVVEGFCMYDWLMEQIKDGKITIQQKAPEQKREDWMFNNLRRELLDRSPLWRKISRYKGLGLTHREIALLVHKEVSTVRKHVRRMENCGLLLPPKDLPKLQGYAKHFRLN
ncbi:hypothetical protein KsCSTR_18460 [Candidatus Kuenenia stuttgartiensis]|uniref:KilA-N DNA-binding domain-containing protein n=1 Tax=Kuenenia stuttgartiensis TaxID=174633 RepID=A0A6G7GNY2_KUEST|nr:ORF6N domain-containing protein [Candidatus Kuenenia stuttgartiensis]QII11225.1 hypothetical protein KsCSTR_18460 [Candidatus Kuenenia stuttgartiensis]